MRQSKFLVKTIKEVPKDTKAKSYQFLIRAGYLKKLASGIYDFLPLGYKIIKKIEEIIREEMNKIGGQEVFLPVLHPAKIWEESGRWGSFGPELFKLKNRSGGDFALGPTHEEIITDIVKNNVKSYRDLPIMLYQIQKKLRDEPRPSGILRLREFLMKDAYSFHTSNKDLDNYYLKVKDAYCKIFSRCGLETIVVEADPGAMGGAESEEFMILAPAGEDTVVLCSKCDYAANIERAMSVRQKVKKDAKKSKLEEVPTPGDKTIADIAKRFKVPKSKTLKAVFYTVDDKEVVFVIIRGDIEVNEAKLKKVLSTSNVRLATDKEVRKAELIAGSASPIDIAGKVKIIADLSIKEGNNFIVGANRKDFHFKGANYPRDFKVDIIADIAQVAQGDLCSKCGSKLKLNQAVEVGHIFKLGTKYSKSMGALFTDKKGNQKPIISGCYGIGLERIMASVVEQSYDKKGIIWPCSLAPFKIHLLVLDYQDKNVVKKAEELYNKLSQENIQILFDDREESAGVKFADADLIGIPFRVIVSKKSLSKDSVELKPRGEKKISLIKLDKLIEKLKNL
jgi:prolyl-tRNA synthetase